MLLSIVSAVITALAGLTPGPQSGDYDTGRLYANQTPYGNAATSEVTPPPDGYEIFFLQNVGRHGARSLTSDDEEEDALETWAEAFEADALTPVGEQLQRDITDFQTAEKRIGYGRLSAVGKAEWAGIGRRTADNYRELFEQAAADGDGVAFVHSPVKRTDESGEAMKGVLASTFPQLTILPDEEDEDTLVIRSGSTSEGRAAMKVAMERPEVVKASVNVLETMYSPEFVASLDLDDQVEEALAVYKLYQTAPGMAGETSVTFADYVAEKDARELSRVRSAETFYKYGPGVTGQTSSYEDARPLLQDFFRRLDERIAGGKTAAVFRLAHGETTMPFGALIKVPGSDTQVPAGQVYDKSNPWRAYRAGLLAGNIEWAAYRNAEGNVLVTMRYNENPVAFHDGCVPESPGSTFYTPTELKRCLGSL